MKPPPIEYVIAPRRSGFSRDFNRKPTQQKNNPQVTQIMEIAAEDAPTHILHAMTEHKARPP